MRGKIKSKLTGAVIIIAIVAMMVSTIVIVGISGKIWQQVRPNIYRSVQTSIQVL